MSAIYLKHGAGIALNDSGFQQDLSILSPYSLHRYTLHRQPSTRQRCVMFAGILIIDQNMLDSESTKTVARGTASQI